MVTPAQRVTLRIPLAADAPAAARQAVTSLPAIRHDPGLSDDVGLALSEVVTNILVHADVDEGEPIELTAIDHGDLLYVEVWDPGAGFDPEHAAGGFGGVGGWGLLMVDQLADRWAVASEAGGTRFWFEIDRGGRPVEQPVGPR